MMLAGVVAVAVLVALAGLVVGAVWLGMVAEAQRHLPEMPARTRPRPSAVPARHSVSGVVEMRDAGGRWVAEVDRSS